VLARCVLRPKPPLARRLRRHYSRGVTPSFDGGAVRSASLDHAPCAPHRCPPRRHRRIRSRAGQLTPVQVRHRQKAALGV